MVFGKLAKLAMNILLLNGAVLQRCALDKSVATYSSACLIIFTFAGYYKRFKEGYERI